MLYPPLAVMILFWLPSNVHWILYHDLSRLPPVLHCWWQWSVALFMSIAHECLFRRFRYIDWRAYPWTGRGITRIVTPQSLLPEYCKYPIWPGESIGLATDFSNKICFIHSHLENDDVFFVPSFLADVLLAWIPRLWRRYIAESVFHSEDLKRNITSFFEVSEGYRILMIWVSN